MSALKLIFAIMQIMVFKNSKSLYSLKIKNVSLILERTKMHQFCNLCNVASYVEFMYLNSVREDISNTANYLYYLYE